MLDQDRSRPTLIEELTDLRRRETHAQSMLANAPFFVCIVNRAGTIQFLSRTAPGFTMADAIGKSTYDFTEPAYRQIARECIERVFDTGQTAFYESLAAGPNGSSSWYETHVGPVVENGQVVAVSLIATDMTERKRSEEAVRASEAKYRRLYESLMDAFACVDMNGRILECNEAFQKMLGYDANELLKLRYTDLTPEIWHPFETEILRTQILPRGHSDVYEKEYRRKDGTVFPVNLRTFLIKDEQGQPSGMWAIVRDVTDRKRAEAALNKAYDELEQRVEERTRDLTHSNKALSQEIEQRKKVEEEVRQSRELLQAVIDNTPALVYVKDLEGRTTIANQPLAEAVGKRLSDVIGRTTQEYVADAVDAAEHVRNDLQVIETGQSILAEESSRGRVFLSVKFPLRDAQGKIFAVCGVSTDITERKRAEEELQQTNSEIKAIYDGMPDGLVVAEIESKRFVRCNAAMSRMLGYSKSELLQRSVADIHPAADLPRVMEAFQALVTGAQRLGQDIPVQCKDGSIFHADITHNEIVLNGRQCSVGFFRDVTERRQAQEQLRRLSERLSLATNAANVGIWDWDLRSNRQVWDDTMYRLYGYAPAAIAAGYDSWQSIVHPDDGFRVIAEVQSAFQGTKEFDTEFRVVWPDGSIHWIKANGMVERDAQGTAVRMLGTNWDITHRKLAEEALRESEERYRSVVEDQTEIICRLAADGTITFVNEVFCRFFGKSSRELHGSLWHPNALAEDVPLIEAQLRTLSPGNPVVVIENRVYSGLGELRWVQFVNHGFFDAAGQLTAIQVVGRDVTDRKRAEEALRKEHRNIKHLLHSSDHERQLIAYEIHDGLAQHLAGAIMQMQASAHLKETNPRDAEKAFQAALTMVQQGHFEARRLIAGVRPPVLDESGVMEAVAHLVHEEGRSGGPKIDFNSRVNFDRLDPTLENAIYRIAQEGLTNACKHSKSDRVWLGLLQREDWVRIEIRDWGAGFDPKSIPKNRYGLEGIRQRARLLGGKCSIRSRAGAGTRVVVDLPLVLRDD